MRLVGDLGAERELTDTWRGGWLVVDLPGHGRSAWDAPYSFAGHSLGGMVALELADGTTPTPAAVVALGVKVS